MKVILLENVAKIGSIGEIIDVKRGFARNYLILNKKALYASKENIKEVEKIKTELNKKDQEKKKNAKQIYENLKNKIYEVKKLTTENNDLYGSIKPTEISTDTSFISLSNGMGKRSLISMQLGESFLPIGSVIRSANLILSYDTTLTSSAYNVIIDPIENDSMYVDSTDVYDLDPFEAIGYPYRVSTDSEKGSCILSIKDILQNITLGNVDNLGFKLIANEKNDPFEFIQFEKNNDMRIEIIYVSN